MSAVLSIDKSREIIHASPKYVMSSTAAGEVASSLEKKMRSLCSIVSGAAAEIAETAETDLNKKSTENQLAIKASSLKVMISKVSMYFENSWRVSLTERLDELLSPLDWDEEDVVPSERSFSTFLRMMIYLHPTKRPGIGLSASGNFVAAWSRKQDRLIIECLARDEVRWVLFRELGDDRESGAGKSQIHRIPEVTAAYEPEKLLQNGDKIII
jgi:hypothetical protein